MRIDVAADCEPLGARAPPGDHQQSGCHPVSVLQYIPLHQ